MLGGSTPPNLYYEQAGRILTKLYQTPTASLEGFENACIADGKIVSAMVALPFRRCTLQGKQPASLEASSSTNATRGKAWLNGWMQGAHLVLPLCLQRKRLRNVHTILCYLCNLELVDCLLVAVVKDL